jgi:Fic family protein
MSENNWNWELKEWPNFKYDSNVLQNHERVLLQQSGYLLGTAQHLLKEERISMVVSLLSSEAFRTAEIEGELLNRASLHSSIERRFGLSGGGGHSLPREDGIAKMMLDLYSNFPTILSESILLKWHTMLMAGYQWHRERGVYRSDVSPMQIVSGTINNPKVHFVAPSAACVPLEMSNFIEWFNNSAPNGSQPLPSLIRAGIAHLWFLSIHPFEDGNGRIGRALVEKVLSQHIGQPTLISLSQAIGENKKMYYKQLGNCNHSLEITQWLSWFSEIILKGQRFSQSEIDFILKKASFFDIHGESCNVRQLKVLRRIFREGQNGFAGGLSAKNYMSITGTSPSTATRDLHQLVQMGALTKGGRRKATRYGLNLQE